MGGGHFVILRLTFNSNFVIAFNQDPSEIVLDWTAWDPVCRINWTQLVRHGSIWGEHFVILRLTINSNFVMAFNQDSSEIVLDWEVSDPVCRNNRSQLVRHTSMGGGHFVILCLTINSNFVMAFNQDSSEIVLDWTAWDPVCRINRTQLVRHTSMGGGHFVILRLTFNSNFVITFNQDPSEIVLDWTAWDPVCRKDWTQLVRHASKGDGHFVILRLTFYSNFVTAFNQDPSETVLDRTAWDPVCRINWTQLVRHTSMGGTYIVILRFPFYSNFVIAFNQDPSEIVLDWTAWDPVCRINRSQLVRHASKGGGHFVILRFPFYSNFVTAFNQDPSETVLDWTAWNPVCRINRTQLVRHTSMGGTYIVILRLPFYSNFVIAFNQDPLK